jgi:hypothetical protein
MHFNFGALGRFLARSDEAQLINQLISTGLRVGLLISSSRERPKPKISPRRFHHFSIAKRSWLMIDTFQCKP